MDVNIKQSSNITIFDIGGRVIGPDSLELKRIIDEAIASVPGGTAKILFNLADVHMMDSSALGVIIATYTLLQRQKGCLALSQPSKNVQQLLAMAKLNTVFDIYDTEDEALASLA